MKRRYTNMIIGALIWNCTIGNIAALAQKYNYINREQLADAVFPPLAPALRGQSYDSRLILRFSEPAAEIVITIHDGTKTVVFYRLASRGTLGEEIAQALRVNPSATVPEIAAGIQIQNKAVSVPQGHVDRWLRDLKTLTTPLLESAWFNADGPPEYDLWVDSNGDTLRYHFAYAPTHGIAEHPFAPVARWMEMVRSEVAPHQQK